MPLDKDLQSIQEMRELVQKAKQAQLEFRAYDQGRVDRIVKAMADAGFDAAERLGRMAHEETGFGKPDDKKKKNEFATRRVWESIKDLRSVGVIREDREKKIIEIAEPMGVVCALIPSTNPTSTVMFKAIISVKGRNGIVASPHPRAAKCTTEAMNVVAQAAEAAGAPQGLMGCLSNPTIEATNELMKHKGIGEAKAITIVAAMELGNRRRETEALQREQVTSSKDAAAAIQRHLADLPHEEFWILMLNRANKIIGKHAVSQGGIAGTVVDAKMVFKPAVEHSASSVILCHNHPSGSLKPSRADEDLTHKIKEAAKYFDIRVLDHMIVSDAGYFSFADEGLL